MENQGRPGRALLLLIAILGWLGLALQLVVSAHVAAGVGRSPFAAILDALGYFTVLTNLLVAIVATLASAWGIAGDQAGRTAWCEIPAWANTRAPCGGAPVG